MKLNFKFMVLVVSVLLAQTTFAQEIRCTKTSPPVRWGGQNITTEEYLQVDRKNKSATYMTTISEGTYKKEPKVRNGVVSEVREYEKALIYVITFPQERRLRLISYENERGVALRMGSTSEPLEASIQLVEETVFEKRSHCVAVK